MLNLMRRHASSWWVKALLITVALSFIIGFGILSSVSTKSQLYVARIGDQTITPDELIHETSKYYEENREYLGDDLTDEEYKDLENHVLKNMIYQILEINEARRINIPVNNNEVRETISRDPNFQYYDTGGFSYEVYSYILRANGLTEEDYEAIVREDIMLSRFRSLIKDSVRISDEEVLIYVNVMWKEVESLDELTPDERENYYELALSIKRINFYDQYITKLYRNTDIEINPDLI